MVTATTLNVRSTPVIKEENKIAALSENQVVARREIVGDGSWWKISAVNNGQLINGYVASRFLASAPRQIRAIGWFKSQFGDKIRAAVSGTPFDLNLLTAIAMQETYYIWGNLYPLMSETEVLTLCTGDTIDSPSRSAFPKNKADLLSFAKGAEMFGIARTALENVAHHIPSFKTVVESSPSKFCRGYGIFQLDLQFFKDNPDYFLEKKWSDFDECLSHCVNELKAAMRRAFRSNKQTLTDEEKVYVAIAYNRGSVDFAKKFKQGFRDSSGKYYGEYIWDYLRLAKSVP